MRVPNHSQTTQVSVGVSCSAERPPYCDQLRLSPVTGRFVRFRRAHLHLELLCLLCLYSYQGRSPGFGPGGPARLFIVPLGTTTESGEGGRKGPVSDTYPSDL